MAVVVWACLVLPLTLEALPASSPRAQSYYDTLHVEPAAADNQIKKSFRKLASKYHPDKNKCVHAETKFREIVEAYHVLSNQKKRSVYDSVGHEAFLSNEASVDPGAEYSDGFYFRFADLFHDIDPFAEETHFHWSFQQAGDNVGAGFQYDGVKDPFLGAYFGGDHGDDNLL